MRKFTAYGPSLLVIATALSVLLAGPTAVRQLTYAQTHARIALATSRLEDENNILKHMNQAYRDIASAVEPSVVHISASREADQAGVGAATSLSAGSGWIYDELGHIITNHHVVSDADRIDVQLYNGEIRPAVVVGYDPSTDIAVIKIEPGRLHPAVRADPSNPLVQGDLVFAFGSPFDFRFSMSSGVVSGQGRSVGVIRDQFGQSGYENFIQVDAAINPGNSGGPLTDYRGHVVGMNTAIATGPRGRHEEGQFAGVGLAIPIEMIEPVVSQLISTGQVRKGFLGVTILDRSDTVRREMASLGFSGEGIIVVRVDPDLPGLGGALLPRDVITRVNGHPVDYPAPASLGQFLALLPADDETTDLTIWRFDPTHDAGGRLVVTVPTDSLRMSGLVLIEPSELVSRRLELLGFANHGVLVPRLDPSGPAAGAGLKPGDVLTHINGREVGQSGQVRSLISSMLPDQNVDLRIWRYDPVQDAGTARDFDITLAELEPARIAGRLPETSIRDSIPELGIARMSTATPEATEQYGGQFHEGVLLEQLVPGSSLHQSVQPGSIIIGVMGRPVRGVDEFVQMLRTVNLARGATIVLVDRDGNHITHILRLQ